MLRSVLTDAVHGQSEIASSLCLMRVLPTMDLDDVTARIREHYLEQFRAFIHEQKRGCTQGASEVKLRLSEKSEVFQHLYCVDFIKNDGTAEIVELQPDRFLRFEPISGSLGGANLQVEALRWDDLVIHHDAPEPLSGIDPWFEQWFDPEDKRRDEDAEFSGVIHSLLVLPDRLSIDFGSAPTTAFWTLLDLLEQEGAKSIRVSSSRDETERE